MTATCIAIKTCGADLRSFVELQSDLLHFGYDGCVRVCVPDADYASFRRALCPRSELVVAEDLLRRFDWHWGLKESWWSQQLLKLLLVASAPAEACWVLDANTLLMRPLRDPWDGDQVVLALADLQEADQRWFVSSARFLGLPTTGPSMAPVNQPLRCSVARALLASIERRYGRSPVHTLFASMIAGCRRDNPFWTEYGLYRAFAVHSAGATHSFEWGHGIAYYRYNQEGNRMTQWLRSVRRSKPEMVKVYARRPGFRMGREGFRRVCDEIRRCR